MFRCLHQKRVDQNSRSKFFLYLTKNVALKTFCFGVSISAPEEPHVDLATQVHPIQKNNVFLVYLGFLWHPTEQQQIKCSITTCLVRSVTKKRYFKVFRWAVLDGGTLTSLFLDEILDDCTWLFSSLWNRLKLVQRSYQHHKIWKKTCLLPHARGIHRRRAVPCLFVSAELALACHSREFSEATLHTG